MASGTITPPPGFQLEAQPQTPPQAITPPPGFQLESQPQQATTTPESADLPTRIEGAFNSAVHTGAQGLAKTGSDIWQTVKGIATGGGVVGATKDLYDNIKETLPVIHAYENARSSGRGIMDSLTVANDEAKRQLDARDALKQRIEEFKKNPAVESVRAIGDAAALVGSLYMGGGSGAGADGEALSGVEAAAPEAAEANPGLIEQIVKGKDVSQPQAQEALRGAGESVSQDTGASTVAPKSLRETLSDPINANESEAEGLYKQIDDAAGTDFKGLGNKLKNTNRALRQSVDSAEEAKLAERRDDIEATIETAKKTALENGVDPAVIDQADAHFKRMSALSDVEAKVFKNPNVVSGNAAMGTEETVNIDSAIKALQKLQDSEAFGAPRLEQAFGKDGANQLLSKLYAAQRQGVHAMKVQQVAKWVGAAAGLSAGATAAGAVKTAVSAATP